MKVRDIIKVLDQDGWITAVEEDNLRQFRRHGLRERVTLGGRLDDELDEKMVDSILRQAKLRKGDT